MKRVLSLLLAVVAFCACEKSESPVEVTVKLDYNLPESGSMSRGGAELYADFYDKHIATRELTPSTYELTFTNTADQSTVVINDQWAKGHALKLLSGTYKVTGESASVAYDNQGGIDTLFLKFDEEIAVDATTTKITLNAIYDSSMIFFDAADVVSATYYFGSNNGSSISHKLAKVGSIYYCFVQSVDKITDEIRLRKNSGSATIEIRKMTFEKGKYYYFGDLSSEYNLPAMEGGN